MAYVQAQALIHRIREVLEQSAGTLRTVPSGRFQGDWPQGLSDATQARIVFANPRVRVNLESFSRSQYSPPINGNIVIYDIGVSVIVARLFDREKQITSDDYDAVQAYAAEDTDVIRQALEWPGNLTTTSTGSATDLISGMLAFIGPSTNQVVGLIDQGAQRFETTNRFGGYLIARAATS